MNEMPHELAWGDVYYSPLIPVFSVALIASWLTITVLNKMRLSRYIVFPNATFIALMVAYMLLLDQLWIKI
jgi:hypothetical protein